MGIENWRCPNSRKKSSIESLLRLNRLDWAAVLAEGYGVDILSQHCSNYGSHFPSARRKMTYCMFLCCIT